LTASAQTAVVCDSTAYLPCDLLAEREIQTISLYVSVDDRQERELEIGDYAAFYERLRASESGATTSQPSVGDFISIYEPLLDAGREIVSIHISAGISGTFEAASQARQRLLDEDRGGERIHVMDSRTAAGGMGLTVLGASAAAMAGGDAEACVARAEKTREELKMWFAIDTLEYLRRGGRIGGARAWIGSALKIKPILTLEEEITPVEGVGTRPPPPHQPRDPRPLTGTAARLRPPAPRAGSRRLGRPAHPGRGDRRRADRRRARDLWLRAGLRLRDRRRPRRPRRSRPARHRQRADRARLRLADPRS
jgi:DegV family protein with EDD domain